MLEARSAVVLGGVQFTTDPRTYERQWAKRQSRHATLGGGVTIQDFGRKAKDLVLRLESGGNFMSGPVVDQVDALFGTAGGVHSFVDWHGTEATVYIADFTPAESHLPDLFEYSLTLWVRTLAKLRGVPYAGE